MDLGPVAVFKAQKINPVRHICRSVQDDAMTTRGQIPRVKTTHVPSLSIEKVYAYVTGFGDV